MDLSQCISGVFASEVTSGKSPLSSRYRRWCACVCGLVLRRWGFKADGEKEMKTHAAAEMRFSFATMFLKVFFLFACVCVHAHVCMSARPTPTAASHNAIACELQNEI